MGAYAQCAERLIERGFAAVPIMPGTKRPGFFFAGMWIGLANWQRRFNGGPPPATERERWAAGDTGVGVVAGQASHGLIAVDIDSEDPAIQAALQTVLPPTHVRKTGARGETLFYYGPEIAQSQSWNIAGKRVVDLIGPGRQTVLPPTIHPDTGAPYRWSGSESLEDLQPHELPTLPADIAERITAALLPLGYRPEPPPHEHSNGGNSGDGDSDNPHRQLNDEALANLDAWVPALMLYRCRRTQKGYEAVPTWRPSTTGRELGKRHLNLKIVPEGIRDFGADQGYTPLDLVMAACDCDLDTAFRFLSERLGWASDLDLSALRPPADEAAAEPVAGAAAKPKAPIDELARFTTVPGVVGEIVDWIIATSRRPNRVLALGAAVTVVGTLIGRRAAGPTRSATHLYAVGIAPTGSGKQHLLDSVIRLMEAAKASNHIGPSKFFSLSAVLDLLSSKPLVLCVAGRDRGLPQGRHQQESDRTRGGREPDPAGPVGHFFRQHADAGVGAAQDADHLVPGIVDLRGLDAGGIPRRAAGRERRQRLHQPFPRSQLPTFAPPTVTRNPIRAACQPFSARPCRRCTCGRVPRA